MEHTDHPFPAPAGYDRLVQTIRRRLQGAPLLIAIDGRCGAGKTTLAQRLQQELGGRVFHMDDFFLRPEQRTAARRNGWPTPAKTWITSAFWRRCWAPPGRVCR